MATITKQAFLEAGERRYENVEIPGLGTTRVRSLTEPEKTKYYAARFDENGKFIPEVWFQRSPRLLVLAVVDDNGERMFSDSEEDLAAVIALDSKLTEPVYKVARPLSNIDANEETGGDRETEKKPDSAADTDSSGS